MDFVELSYEMHVCLDQNKCCMCLIHHLRDTDDVNSRLCSLLAFNMPTCQMRGRRAFVPSYESLPSHEASYTSLRLESSSPRP